MQYFSNLFVYKPYTNHSQRYVFRGLKIIFENAYYPAEDQIK
jgi:hypothetical protein